MLYKCCCLLILCYHRTTKICIKKINYSGKNIFISLNLKFLLLV